MSIMTEISCSIGDLSSTPSNRSEYFSINSSLSILDSTEEVYHSFSEDIETEIQGNFGSKLYKIVKQNHLDVDIEDNGYKLSLSDAETIPESVTCRNSAECDFMDTCLQSLHALKSQESVNSVEREQEDDDDEEINNSSTFSNSQIKECSVIEKNGSKNLLNNGDSGSSSTNNGSPLNSSHIDREFSATNDTVHDSVASPSHDNDPITPEHNTNSQSETDIDIISDSCQSRKGSVISNDESLVINILVEQIVSAECLQKNADLPADDKIGLENEQLEKKSCVFCDETEIKETKAEENNYIVENEKENNVTCSTETKRYLMENDRTPPMKRFYLCCSFRSKSTDGKKSKKKDKLKPKRFFSLFKKSNQEKIFKAEIIIEPDGNQTDNVIVKSIDMDYDVIPFIDADVDIDSETFISLAKQEMFSE